MTDAIKLLLEVVNDCEAVPTDNLKPIGEDADAALSKLHQILNGSRRHEAEQAPRLRAMCLYRTTSPTTPVTATEHLARSGPRTAHSRVRRKRLYSGCWGQQAAAAGCTFVAGIASSVAAPDRHFRASCHRLSYTCVLNASRATLRCVSSVIRE
jgi:hypothetical protein